jgi:hypothetical protein
MSERVDFALKSRAQRGDSAFLLNSGRHRLAFDPFPGRYIVLAFLGSTADAVAEAVLAALSANRRMVEDRSAAFFAVVAESGSGPATALKARFPSIRFLWDGDEMARAFGADRSWVILDPMLRVIDVAPLGADRVLAHLSALPPPDQTLGFCAPAPILTLAHVFEPELCAHLVACFERGGGKDSGFMQDESGRSVENFDDSWKRRRDFHLTDAGLITNLRVRIGRRICPEIKKAFQMRPNRIRARPCRALRRRDRRAFRSPSRRYGHVGLAPPVRGVDQSQRGLRGRRDFVSRVLSARLQGRPWSSGRVLRFDSAPGVASDLRAALCVPDLPVR